MDFSGMNPYLEEPDVWPGFHDAFLFCVREALQPVLPAGLYAEMNTREEIGIAGANDRVLYADASIKRADEVREDETTEPDHLVIAEAEPLTVRFLEVRTVGEGRLVTLIELLSPSNKLPGPDRESFERKQADVLRSDTHWVEIDLLRRGRRLGGHPNVDAHCRSKGYDYVVVVSRSERRAPIDLEVYGFTVRDRFPTIAVPLRADDPDVSLDLNRVFRRAFDTGPYAKTLDYGCPLDPPLATR